MGGGDSLKGCQSRNGRYFALLLVQTLTLGPGGPTLPAAPGKPVAPFKGPSEGGDSGLIQSMSMLVLINSFKSY